MTIISLAEKPSSTIRNFAAHWGPLGICKHLAPWTHSLTPGTPKTRDRVVCPPLGSTRSRGAEGWEPLDRWRDYSRLAGAITRDAIVLKNRRERPRVELEGLFYRVAGWLEVAAVPLLTYAEVNPKSVWPCGLQATFAFTGVFQVIAVQLLGVVAGGRALALCAHCGIPFALNGHREGQRRFCQRCIRAKVPTRYASRNNRTRRREAPRQLR